MSVIPCYLCGEEVVCGEDYRIHITFAHGVKYDEDEVFRNVNENKTNNLEKNRNKFDQKVRDLLDLAEGVIEPTDTIENEDVEIVDENMIWLMFENLKTKVKNMKISNKTRSSEKEPPANISNIMDISDKARSSETESPLNILNTIDSIIADTQDDSIPIRSANSFEKMDHNNTNNSNASKSHTKEAKKWYQGTFYECKICKNIFYGPTVFRRHLINTHKIPASSKNDLPGYCSNFDEKFYSCKVCNKIIPHVFDNIYSHMKSAHSFTLQEYEEKYENKEMNSTNKLQPIRSELPLRKKTKLDQLMPVKSQRENPPKNDDHLQDVRTSSLFSKPKSFHEPIVTNHDEMVNSKASSFYYCPIQGCPYRTNKEGMKRGHAAMHLQRKHQMKAKDMKPGECKFNKMKV